MKTNLTTLTALIALAVIALSMIGCVAPTPNAGYFAMSPEQAEANRRNTHRIEQEGRDTDNQERMSRATATEVATRNMPSTVIVESPHHYWW